MEKIQLKAFDARRNQNFWFHFCYIPQDVWALYKQIAPGNMDAQIKAWIKQDFNFDIVTADDVYKAKELIKGIYAEAYPEVFLQNEGDRQGWTRVWLTQKIKRLLEEAI
jgi:hypothetical protein